MSRKPIIGKCRLCGEIKKLTFEHVPPETTFNNYSVHILSGEQVIKQIADSNNLPWDFSETKGTIQQRGRGGYYLCGDCNSKTGQWYVPEYSKFVHIVHSALQEVKGKEFGALGIKMKGIKPLAIFKQVMTLFCDINEGMISYHSLNITNVCKNNCIMKEIYEMESIRQVNIRSTDFRKIKQQLQIEIQEYQKEVLKKVGRFK